MDKKRTEILSIRLSEEEGKLLRSRIGSKGISMSAYVRKLLVDNVQGKEKMIPAEAISDKRLTTAMAIKSRFKKMASQYGTIANIVQVSLEQAAKDGAHADGLRDAARSFRALENITLELQRSVNEYFSIEGVKQELPVYRRNLPVGVGRASSGYEKSKFTYMEKIQIIGSVGSEMQAYKDKFGNEKAKFGVTSQTGKNERKYVVFARRSNLPESVPVGTTVFASGDFEVQESGVIAIYADTVKVMA